MKKTLNVIVIALLLMTFILPGNINASTTKYSPTSKFYINDFADILNTSTEENIFNTSRVIDERTTAQLVVVTVPSLDGRDIESYANELFREWKIGNKEKNNGILLLISKEDRKIRIEVGYGLEGALPDSKAGRILDDIAIPYLKENDYDSAVNNVEEELKGIIYKEYGIEGGYDNYTEEEGNNIWSVVGGIIVMIIMAILFIKNPWLFLFMGGRGGSGRGGFGGRRRLIWRRRRFFWWWWRITWFLKLG